MGPKTTGVSSSTGAWQQSRQNATLWPPSSDQHPHVCATWHRLLRTSLQHAADQHFWQQHQYSSLPSAERLAMLRTRFRTELSGQCSRVAKERRGAPTVLYGAYVEHNHGRAACRSVQEPLAPAMTSLMARSQATLRKCNSSSVCSGVLRSFADMPIRLASDVTHTPAVCASVASSHCPALKQTLSTGGYAGGLDGWRTAEIRALPTWVWDSAADFWNAMTKTANMRSATGPLPLVTVHDGRTSFEEDTARSWTKSEDLFWLVPSVVVCHPCTVTTLPGSVDPPQPLSGGVKHRDVASPAWEVAQVLKWQWVVQSSHYTGLLDATKYWFGT